MKRNSMCLILAMVALTIATRAYLQTGMIVRVKNCTSKTIRCFFQYKNAKGEYELGTKPIVVVSGKTLAIASEYEPWRDSIVFLDPVSDLALGMVQVSKEDCQGHDCLVSFPPTHNPLSPVPGDLPTPWAG